MEEQELASGGSKECIYIGNGGIIEGSYPDMLIACGSR